MVNDQQHMEDLGYLKILKCEETLLSYIESLLKCRI